uniref:Putative transposase (Putative), gypsy type n=1 Tax=Tanacetum cinerariifolium TaxID=118510 RepID=A0A6L2NDY0_TANCI|nr:putative transposase (putative), gypsy type [Tanacetum cinerariifolium]
MFELLDKAIGVTHQIFDFSSIRTPFSSFLLALIKHYRIHLSQLGPLGLNKVITFEVLCRSLQIEPTVALFRVFQTLCKQGNLFSFAKRRAPSLVYIDDNCSSIDDPQSVAGLFSMVDVRHLSAHVIKLRDITEGVLVLSGLSHVWKSRVCDMLWAFVIFSAFLSRPVLSAKILAKTKASHKQKASTSGATSSHVAKHTRFGLAQSSGSTTRLSLFMENSDDGGDAYYRGKGIMVDDAAAPSASSVAGNYEFTHEEWDAPYRPTFGVLTKEVFKDPAVCKTMVDQFPTPGETVRVESLSNDQLTAKISVLHCMMMSHGGELLARYHGLLQSHHEYVLLVDSRLKGYKERFAGLTGLELQVSALKRQVSRLNDKLSSSDASFVKSKAKGNKRKKKIKSLTKSLDNLHAEVARLSADLNQALIQDELLFLAVGAGFERGLSMHQTKDEFATVLKKMAHFMPGAQCRLAEASLLVAQPDHAFLNKISKHESTVTPAFESLELPANFVLTSSVVASEQNEESAFVQGTSYVLDEVAEVTVVGSKHVSFSPGYVVVALYVGENVNGEVRGMLENIVAPSLGKTDCRRVVVHPADPEGKCVPLSLCGGKEIIDIAAQTPSANTIVPGMFKLDLDPLAPKLLQNKEAHIDYLKYTQEQADILQGIVEQAKAKQPLDNALDFSFGNSCPLTRITSANVVPSKKTTSHLVETQKPELKVYSRKPKNVKNVGSSKKAKSVKSKNANHSKCNHTGGSNAIDIPSSSSLDMTGCPDCSLISGLRMSETHDRKPLSAHELFPVAATPRAVDLADSHVSTSIDQDALSASEVDPTLFTWKAGNDLLLVQIYVDDIISASTNTAMCNEFANQMTTKFKMSMMGFALKFQQEFEDLPLEQDILSFIRDIRHSGDITYLTNVNVDYLHQSGRAFSTVINKCLSGKETRIDKIRLSQKKLQNQTTLKKADSDTFPKKKHVQATKDTRIKTKAKMAKSNKNKQPAKKPKAKGLAVLSEVALTEAKQLKMATKRSKKDFHISHASGSGNEVSTQLKVHNEQQQKTSCTNEGTGTITGVPDVPIYDSKTDKESWRDSDEEDNDKDEFEDDVDNDDGSSDDHDDENEEEDDEVTKEFYKDVNVNLGNKDADMTDVDQGGANQQNASQQSRFEQEEEDAHVTLTLVLETQKSGGPTQSSSVSSGFTSKLLNLNNPSPTDTMIASLMDTTVHHEITSAKTVPLPPPFFNPLQQEATPTPTPTTFKATTSFTSLLDFASIFKFKERVTNLEKDLSEIKQVDKYAQALSSIPTIVDRYMDNKLGEAINKANQAHNFDYVATLVIEKNVTESLEAAVLTRSSSQPQSSYEAAATLSEFKLTKILIDKMEKNKSFDVADYKRELYDAFVKYYNTNKDIFESYSEVFSLKRSRDERDKDRDPSTGSDRGTKRRKSSKDAESSRDSKSKEKKSSSNKIKSSSWKTMMNNPLIRRLPKLTEPSTSFDELNDTSFDFSAFFMNWLKFLNLTQAILVGLAFNLLKGTCKSIMELEHHLEECFKATTERFDWHNPENKLYPFDLRKPLPLIQDHRGRQIIPRDYFINKYLEYLKVEIQADDTQLLRAKDLQLGVESYPKKLNLTKPNTNRSNLRNKTAYTSYSDPHGIIYVDQYMRKRLMRADELHKFSDGTLNDVRSALYDIVAGIRMEYLRIRKWSNLDRKMAQIMVQDIDKQLYQRRLMHNLEKFVGGRVYRNDLRLLERTI